MEIASRTSCMKQLIWMIFLWTFSQAQAANSPIKVLMVVNEGYRPEEYFEPREAFDHAGFEVKIAGNNGESLHPSRAHIREVAPLKVDFTFDRVFVKDYDAVVFVGGNGAWNDFLPNTYVHKILLESVRTGKITALICAATGLLATANNLSGESPQFKDRHVTGYSEVEGLLKRLGQLNYERGIQGKPLVISDGNLITGKDPSSAKIFGATIVSALRRSR